MDIKGKKVLVVDDDKFFISLISKKLTDGGLEVSYAYEGQAALKGLEDNKPDVIILDIMLPDMDGYEILKKIKDNPATNPIPVVFLSNLGSRDDIVKGRQLGAHTFLIKATVTMEEVLKEVSKIIMSKSV